MYRVIYCFWRWDGKRHTYRHPHAAVRKHSTITQCIFNVGPASKTVGQHWKQNWVNATCSQEVCSRPSDGLVLASVVVDWPALNQQWAATLAQHWTGIWWVGLHPLYEVHRMQVLNECWPAPTMVVGGIHVEDVFQLVSLVLSLIISEILLMNNLWLYPEYLGFSSSPWDRPIHS